MTLSGVCSGNFRLVCGEEVRREVRFPDLTADLNGLGSTFPSSERRSMDL